MSGARGQAGLTATVLVAAALPFILTPWKAQALGPSGRGEVGFFGATFSIILGCAALGIRYAYYEVRSRQPERLSVVGRRLLVLAYGVAGVATLLALLVASRSMSPAIMIALAVAWLISPVQLFTQTELSEAQAAQRRMRVAALSSTPALFESAATLLLLLGQRMTVAASVFVTMTSEVLRGLVAGLFRRRDRSVDTPWFDLSRRSVVLAPIGLLPIVVANLDTVVFAWFVPNAVLGEYSVSKLAINVMLLIAVTLEGRVARGLPHRRGFTLVVVALGACAATGAALGYLLTPILFGEEFEATRYAFLVTSIAGWFGSIFTLAAARGAWNGRGRVANVASVVAASVILASSLVLGLLWPDAPAWALGLPALLSYGVAAVIAVAGTRGGNRVDTH
ncbi:oligosaccharide flippase family protein [Microbacterium sp. M3]|uniref:Oligosaccharide flippase family protein n=1 Tax=Microbacterium arthrosphaerae TaxID=792652 RepID=A0ABU4H3G7_9MICO|nr:MULTISPECIES: oligosaccharide flippase family protein [Microbacterium]MDW4573866.1 oligosaccharide flippase family protein [Microbacterium arthrosphaerae]MDW7607721.1 oligosaccharide flippase family protein [Microbacterium sp. M3]